MAMLCNHLLKTVFYLMDSGKKENQGSLYYQKKNLVFVPVVDSSLRDYSLFVPAMQQPGIYLELFGNHVHRGGSLTLESYPEKWNRPALERELDAGAFHQLGRGRGHQSKPEARSPGLCQITGGNPVMPQPSPIEPNQQDRGSNQRGYAEKIGAVWLHGTTGLSTLVSEISQLLAGILTGETAKLV